MSLQIGIVGLPNVGKSTLFNALTKSQKAAAENFPFCTIDPNIGVVSVPDKRLEHIAEIVKPQKTVYSSIEFVDIAGLVKGASQGEGLGNKFLHHINECDAIAMVLRFFEDSNVHHVHGGIDPKSDLEVVLMELIFADLETVNKNLVRAEKDKKSGEKDDILKFGMCKRIKEALENGKNANSIEYSDEELPFLKELHLLTAKSFLYLANIGESEIQSFRESTVKEKMGIDADQILIPISAKVESDLATFSEEEAKELLETLGMKESGLSSVIRAAYEKLGLQSYFTAGEKEAKAWTFHKGAKAPECAGIIHTDFEKHFIKADVVHWDVFVENKGWTMCREKGLVRSEGKEYVMKDGDVCLFKTSA
ncbi:redox-regulated ATPase YchF [Candidatus Peregrinibacteria bacterium]|nr:redox-regulated ATPase YchF [Candidatus Peregrinibacteria bacterium]